MTTLIFPLLNIENHATNVYLMALTRWTFILRWLIYRIIVVQCGNKNNNSNVTKKKISFKIILKINRTDTKI